MFNRAKFNRQNFNLPQQPSQPVQYSFSLTESLQFVTAVATISKKPLLDNVSILDILNTFIGEIIKITLASVVALVDDINQKTIRTTIQSVAALNDALRQNLFFLIHTPIMLAEIIGRKTRRTLLMEMISPVDVNAVIVKALRIVSTIIPVDVVTQKTAKASLQAAIVSLLDVNSQKNIEMVKTENVLLPDVNTVIRKMVFQTSSDITLVDNVQKTMHTLLQVAVMLVDVITKLYGEITISDMIGVIDKDNKYSEFLPVEQIVIDELVASNAKKSFLDTLTVTAVNAIWGFLKQKQLNETMLLSEVHFLFNTIKNIAEFIFIPEFMASYVKHILAVDMLAINGLMALHEKIIAKLEHLLFEEMAYTATLKLHQMEDAVINDNPISKFINTGIQTVLALIELTVVTISAPQGMDVHIFYVELASFAYTAEIFTWETSVEPLEERRFYCEEYEEA